MADDLAELGAPGDLIEAEAAAADEARKAEVVEVWDTHWPIVQVFLACATQWRVAPMGGRSGLDYPAVEWVARRHDLEIDAAALVDLQVLETEALKTWDRAREREARKSRRERGR